MIYQSQFAGSSTSLEERPLPRLPEFAFIGRSNVGKSSLINMLCRRRKLALTSSTPGKTLCINHFLINNSWYLVDLPGYGYAKISKEGRGRLVKMINHYVSLSQEMRLLFVLLDSRLELQDVDRRFITSLGEAGIPFALIYTKSDKIGRAELEARIGRNNATLLETWESLPPIFTSSSRSGAGRDEILAFIDEILNSPAADGDAI